jgi:hypothetical protein
MTTNSPATQMDTIRAEQNTKWLLAKAEDDKWNADFAAALSKDPTALRMTQMDQWTDAEWEAYDNLPSPVDDGLDYFEIDA